MQNNWHHLSPNNFPPIPKDVITHGTIFENLHEKGDKYAYTTLIAPQPYLLMMSTKHRPYNFSIELQDKNAPVEYHIIHAELAIYTDLNTQKSDIHQRIILPDGLAIETTDDVAKYCFWKDITTPEDTNVFQKYNMILK